MTIPNPGILIVIPCLNEAAHIEQLVRYMLAESQALPMQIVIADGGSTDGTVAIAQKLTSENPAVIYLHNPKRLQAAAINLAVATYGGGHEFLIRLDAHAVYPEGYCRVLVENALAQQADSVVVSMITKGTSGFQKAVAVAQNSRLGNGGSAHRLAADQGRWVDHGHHALMRIAAFNTVGGYDESFSHNEDAELDIRLTRGGFKIWLTAKTTLTYYPRSSPMALFRQYRSYGNGRIRTILKHRAIPKIRQVLPAAVLPAAILALATPLTALALVPLLAWVVLCIGYGFTLAEPMVGVAAMIMHFGWSVGFWRGLWEAR